MLSRIDWRALVYYQNRICGLTEAFLWIQLVAEPSLSKRRRLGVAITKARYNFVEGSAFQLNQTRASEKSKDRLAFSELKVQCNRMRASAKTKECSSKWKRALKMLKNDVFYRISNHVFSLKISQISKKCVNFHVSSLFFLRNMMNLHLFYLNLHPNMSIVFKPMDVFFLSRMVNGLIVFYITFRDFLCWV